MNISDVHVFIVGYRRNNNESWQMSGVFYHNEVDATNRARLLRNDVGVETDVFTFDRIQKLNLEIPDLYHDQN